MWISNIWGSTSRLLAEHLWSPEQWLGTTGLTYKNVDTFENPNIWWLNALLKATFSPNNRIANPSRTKISEPKSPNNFDNYYYWKTCIIFSCCSNFKNQFYSFYVFFLSNIFCIIKSEDSYDHIKMNNLTLSMTN